MRYLVLTDIHGNSDALEAVLAAARRQGFDRLLVLGDLVGYGAGPNEVIDAVRGVNPEPLVIRGNHDKVVAALEEATGFNAVAREAAEWTTENLTAENLDYLRHLPQGPIAIGNEILICHGSPLDEDEYVLSLEAGAAALSVGDHPVTFFGHTHLPCVFESSGHELDGSVLQGDSETLDLETGKQYLVNPGSVGQPRDRDPRAAFLIYDSVQHKIHWQRQEYPIDVAQQRILDAGLPRILADRLASGM